MLKKLIINDFKGLESAEYELGQDTIITGRNGVGKSRILQAIIYGYTGVFQGYKKKLDSSIIIEKTNGSISRIKNRTSGSIHSDYVNKFLSKICPGYIHSLPIKEKQLILTNMTEDTHISNSGNINSFKKYKEVKSKYKKLRVLEDQFSEEILSNLEKIKEIGDTNLDSLTDMKARFDHITETKKILENNKRLEEEKESNLKRIKKLETRLEGFDSSISPYDIKSDLENTVRHYTKLKEELTLAEGLCPMCNQEIESNSDRIKELKAQIKEIGITKVKERLSKINDAIENFNLNKAQEQELENLKSIKYDIQTVEIEWTEEDYDDLKIKLDNFQELFAKQQQKELLYTRNEEIKQKIKSMDLLNVPGDLLHFETNARDYFKSLESRFNGNDLGIEIKLYKENKSGDGGQMIFEIYKDGIEYFWLSDGQKLLVDTLISEMIQTEQEVDFILIDNGERLSKDNYDKLLQLIGDKQILITKVSKGDLKVEID